MKTPGQIAYEAYCEKREWKSYDDKPLPQWALVRPEIAEAWDYAALSVILLVNGENYGRR